MTYYGVPADAQAVVTQVTATGGSANGDYVAANGDYVAAYPTGQSVPLASTLNTDAGKTVANLAVVPVGSGNAISLYNRLRSIDLLADVTGFYSPTYGDTAPPTSPPVYTPPPPKALACSAGMSNPNPPRYSNDFVLIQTGAGNAAVSATAHYKTTTTTHAGTSDANGSASIEFQLANSPTRRSATRSS